MTDRGVRTKPPKPPYQLRDELMEVWVSFEGEKSGDSVLYLRIDIPLVPRIGETVIYDDVAWRVADVRWTVGRKPLLLGKAVAIWSVTIFLAKPTDVRNRARERVVAVLENLDDLTEREKK